MTYTCRRGSIVREGYTRRLKKRTVRVPESQTRKAYTRHIKRKMVRVPSGCITAQSQTGIKRTTLDSAMMMKTRKMHERYRKQFGVPKCKPGEIIREGYTRKSYMRKTGVYVDSSKVHPGCIIATGLSKKRGKKGKQLFVLQKGTLTQYDYHADKSELERHESLHKALEKMKPLSVYRKLNALYVVNKNKNPKMATLYRNDADWVKTTHEYMNRSM